MSMPTPISQLGEFGLVQRIKDQCIALAGSTVLKGIGDDAAIYMMGDTCMGVSTEIMMEGLHFDLAYHPLKHLGYKVVVAAISDILAMNMRPTSILISLGLSNRFSVESIDEFYKGVFAACKNYKIELIGGDTAASRSGLTIGTTALGKGEKDAIAYRHGAKVGDLLCVSGDLGAAYVGLQLLEREKKIFQENPDIQPDLENQDFIVGKQLKPEARMDMISYFQKAKFVPTSMIDVSDGLASDLWQLCKASGVGAFIEENQLPINQATKLKALDFGIDPLVCALNGGEDYELLYTASVEDLETVRHLPDTYIIGEVVEAHDGVALHTPAGKIHALEAPGWPQATSSDESE